MTKQRDRAVIAKRASEVQERDLRELEIEVLLDIRDHLQGIHTLLLEQKLSNQPGTPVGAPPPEVTF